MNKISSWIRTIPFLICFATLMLLSDLILRCFWSQELHRKVNVFLNRTVLKFLSTFCGITFDFQVGAAVLQQAKSNLPKIIVANHQSLMDLAMLNVVFEPNQVRFIAKRELAKFLPYVSIALRKVPHCLIDRGDRGQALAAIKEYSVRLKSDNLILVIFPEGTRARDGVMKKFKTGGIQTLVEELGQVMIFPVAINGSYLIAKDKMLPVPANIPVSLKALDPIIVERTQDLKRILEKVENDIKNCSESLFND